MTLARAYIKEWEVSGGGSKPRRVSITVAFEPLKGQQKFTRAPGGSWRDEWSSVMGYDVEKFLNELCAEHSVLQAVKI